MKKRWRAGTGRRGHAGRGNLACVFLRFLLVASLLEVGQVGWANAKPNEAEPQEREIAPEEFLSSPFAGFFKMCDYTRALEALDALTARYPSDPLLIRYRAILLDRLGRYDEAIALYRRLLVDDPLHVPTRFVLAQTYEHVGNIEAALEEWRWVLHHSPFEEYRRWAREHLERVARKGPPLERKRAYLFGDVGMEYDSNPLLKPNDKGAAVPGDEKQAERFSSTLGFGYQLLAQANRRIDLVSTTRQSLHDRGVDAVNFTSEEFAVDAKQTLRAWGRDVILGVRSDVAAGWLDGRVFSLTQGTLLGADMRLTPRTRTYAYQRVAWSNFGPDGSNPPQTSRDGFAYDLGVSQFLYSKDYQRYVVLTEAFELGQTRGANFTRRSSVTRLGAHCPVPGVPRTDLDVSGGLRLVRYPRFTSLSSLEPERRADTNWDLYAALTHYWTPRLAIRVSYRYINANNRNDLFQYDRHIGGVQLLFTQSF